MAYAGPDDGQQTPSVGDALDASPLTEPAPNVDVEAEVPVLKQELPTVIEPSTQASDPSGSTVEPTHSQESETENDDSVRNEVGTTSSGKIKKGKGLEFVQVIYGVSWAVLYFTGSVIRRWWLSTSKGDPVRPSSQATVDAWEHWPWVAQRWVSLHPIPWMKTWCFSGRRRSWSRTKAMRWEPRCRFVLGAGQPETQTWIRRQAFGVRHYGRNHRSPSRV